MTERIERVKRSEFHSYHVTRETDMGILDSGFARGYRFVSTITGCGNSPEEADADLARGGSLRGYRIEVPE